MKHLTQDPTDIDRGTFMIRFRTKEIAEVMDCEGESFCQASPAVAVWIAMMLNAIDQRPEDDGLEPLPGEASKIAEEMEKSGAAGPPSSFSMWRAQQFLNPKG